MKKLIIIGNGFDLAHGYETSYKNFVDNSAFSVLEKFKDIAEKYCDQEVAKGSCWYEFEKMIGIITLRFFEQFQEAFFGAKDEDMECIREKYLYEVSQMNSMFEGLSVRLKEYLETATSGRQGYKIQSISNEVSGDVKIISFNYTNTAERYAKNIYYIHGSLNEADIILGYPLREDPCIIFPEATLYEKKQLREYLAFIRFLKKRNTKLSESDTEDLLNEARRQISLLHSNRGEYDVHENLSEIIKGYIQENNEGSAEIDLGISLQDVEEVVVIGHSLEADEDIINEWIGEMQKLRKVKIFVYVGESTMEIETKKDFFKEYDLDIETVEYD